MFHRSLHETGQPVVQRWELFQQSLETHLHTQFLIDWNLDGFHIWLSQGHLLTSHDIPEELNGTHILSGKEQFDCCEKAYAFPLRFT